MSRSNLFVDSAVHDMGERQELVDKLVVSIDKQIQADMKKVLMVGSTSETTWPPQNEITGMFSNCKV